MSVRVRIDDVVWKTIQERAEKRGQTPSEYLRDELSIHPRRPNEVFMKEIYDFFEYQKGSPERVASLIKRMRVQVGAARFLLSLVGLELREVEFNHQYDYYVGKTKVDPRDLHEIVYHLGHQPPYVYALILDRVYRQHPTAYQTRSRTPFQKWAEEKALELDLQDFLSLMEKKGVRPLPDETEWWEITLLREFTGLPISINRYVPVGDRYVRVLTPSGKTWHKDIFERVWALVRKDVRAYLA